MNVKTTLKAGGVITESRMSAGRSSLQTGKVATDFMVTQTFLITDTTDDVLLESGSFRLLENGDKLLLG